MEKEALVKKIDLRKMITLRSAFSPLELYLGSRRREIIEEEDKKRESFLSYSFE